MFRKVDVLTIPPGSPSYPSPPPLESLLHHCEVVQADVQFAAALTEQGEVAVHRRVGLRPAHPARVVLASPA
ncbi:hypothetical protein ACIBM4_25235 [Streptomyces sp. NPDC050256]|uniref:hypothetical protein n=1 Tax=Streptomyces sp. NPDC050256 TaxID=3365607 RepID=UPI0037B7462D